MSYFAEKIKKLGDIYLDDQAVFYEKLKNKLDDEKMYNTTCKGLRSISGLMGIDSFSEDNFLEDDFTDEETQYLLQRIIEIKEEIIKQRKNK